MAMRSAQVYPESSNNTGRNPVGFDLINAPFPYGHGFGACISSRIPTVIHVIDTIQGTIADLMSHSRFHRKMMCTETCMA